MTEKEIIKRSLSGSLRLPTELTADQIIEHESIKPAIRRSVVRGFVMAAALMLTVGIAGFAVMHDRSGRHISHDSEITPASQTSLADRTLTVNGYSERASKVIGSFEDSTDLYAELDIAYTDQLYDNQISYKVSESKQKDVTSETAKKLGEYLSKVTTLKAEYTDATGWNIAEPAIMLNFESGSGNKILTIRSKNNSSFTSLSYTEAGTVGKGYIRIAYPSGEQEYYSFEPPVERNLSDLSFFSEYGKQLPIKWETSSSELYHYVSKAGFKNSNGSVSVAASEARNNICAIISIDNTQQNPNVRISIDKDSLPTDVKIVSEYPKVTLTPQFSGKQTPEQSEALVFEDHESNVYSIKSKDYYSKIGELCGIDIMIEFEVEDATHASRNASYKTTCCLHVYYGSFE